MTDDPKPDDPLYDVIAEMAGGAVELRRTLAAAERARDEAVRRATQLENTLKLHAGDTCSLSNEIDQWRDEALRETARADEAVADRDRLLGMTEPGPGAWRRLVILNEGLRGAVEKMRRHIKVLLDNDPDDDAADGVSVLEVWQTEARAILAALPLPALPLPALPLPALGDS